MIRALIITALLASTATAGGRLETAGGQEPNVRVYYGKRLPDGAKIPYHSPGLPPGVRLAGAERAGGNSNSAWDPATVLVGDWQDKDLTGTHAPSKWTFTSLGGGRYRVQQTGHGNFTATATLSGSRLRLDWSTTNGFVGNADLTFAEEWTTAKGTFEITSGPANVGKYPMELHRLGAPPARTGPGPVADDGKLATTWRWDSENHQRQKGTSYIMLRPDGKVASSPSWGYQGSWTRTGNTLVVQWDVAGGGSHFACEFSVSPDGRTMTCAKPNYFVVSINATRVAAAPNVADFSGIWDTLDTGVDYVTYLIQDGSRVYGAILNNSGTLEGTVTGRTLKYRWTLGMRSGDAEVTLAPDSRSYSGSWTRPGEAGGSIASKRTIGVAGGGGGRQAIPGASADFTGEWDTTDKELAVALSMNQDGNRVTGTFLPQNGKLSGTVEGKTLKYTWSHPDGRHGEGQFKLSEDGNSFKGFWTENDNFGANWNGTRKGGARTPITTPAPSSGLEGEWEAKDPTGKYAPATWKLTPLGGNRYRLEQVGLAELSGTVSIDGDKIRMDFKTTTGWTGTGHFTIDRDRRSAKGSITLSAAGNPTAKYDYELHRRGVPPSSSGAPAAGTGTAVDIGKLATTWRWDTENHQRQKGTNYILLLPDGKVAHAPSWGYQGSWTRSGNMLTVQWHVDAGGPHYACVFNVSPDGRTASLTKGNYFVVSINARRIAANPGVSDFSGVWDTVDNGNPYVTYLMQDGDRVLGSFLDFRGSIEGTVTGRTLKYKWTLGFRTGQAEMTLAEDGKTYGGNWTAPNEPQGAITARRTMGVLGGSGGGSTASPANVGVLSGDWQDKDLTGLHVPTKWTFNHLGDGKYRVQQTGLSNFTGTATLTGNRLRLDWSTTNGFEGNADLTFAGDWNSAKGTFEITKGFVNVGKYNYELHRLGTTPSGGQPSGNQASASSNTPPADTAINPGPAPGGGALKQHPAAPAAFANPEAPKSGEFLIGFERPKLPAAPLRLVPVGKWHEGGVSRVRLASAGRTPALPQIKSVRSYQWPAGLPEDANEIKLDVAVSGAAPDDRVEYYVSGYLNIDPKKGMRPANLFGSMTAAVGSEGKQNGNFFGSAGLPQVLPALVRVELYHKGHLVDHETVTIDLDLPDYYGQGFAWGTDDLKFITRVAFQVLVTGRPLKDPSCAYSWVVPDVRPKMESPFDKGELIDRGKSFQFSKYMREGAGEYDSKKGDAGPMRVVGIPDWSASYVRIIPSRRRDKDWRDNHIWPQVKGAKAPGFVDGEPIKL